MKHVISSNQFNKENLEELLNLAKDIQGNPKKYENSINGKIVATLFYEPSTRTRLSFESAVHRVGGKILSTENAKEVSSVVKGENLTDTIKTIEGYADAIVIRHSDNDSSEVAAGVSKVPIINAGAGKAEHPTQALLDMYTIREKFGKFDGLKVAISGDLTYGRTTHSLVKLLSLYNNITVYGVSSKYFKLPQEYIDYMEERNVEYIPCERFAELPCDVNAIYHTRTQLERIEDKTIKVEELIINKEVLDRFSKDTIIMHPLPRVNEISEEVDNDPRAVYFEQAHNGVFVRMAILKMLVG
jgi:aspartate carbamoyltransferase catalytic subunit